MRIESSVTSISWIPSEAISGTTKLPFAFGVAHYDDPPPDEIDDLAAMQAADRFRFANELRAWIEVVDGQIVDYGHTGGGQIGSTTLRLGAHDMTLAATAFDDLQPEPELGPDSVRFVQTAGGQTGAPAPRRVSQPAVREGGRRRPRGRRSSSTMNADGTSVGKLTGCSPFPRHWIYDHNGKLVEKSGLIEFKSWYRKAFGKHSPWGDEESPAFATAVESALERKLSFQIMRGGVVAQDPERGQGQDAREAGRRGQGALPRARRRGRDRGRRRGRGRVRAGRGARRAGAGREPRPSHRDDAHGHEVQDRELRLAPTSRPTCSPS